MKSRFIILVIEVFIIEMAALGIILGSNNGSGSFISVIAVLAIGLVLMLVQGYFNIIKPYSYKIRELEAAAAESK